MPVPTGRHAWCVLVGLASTQLDGRRNPRATVHEANGAPGLVAAESLQGFVEGDGAEETGAGEGRAKPVECDTGGQAGRAAGKCHERDDLKLETASHHRGYVPIRVPRKFPGSTLSV